MMLFAMIFASLFSFVLPDGFVELFDGKSITGWHPMNESTWAIEESNLILTGKGGNGWLRSAKKYRDFELSLEWKTDLKQYDSGIYFRALEKGKPWPETGYQLNLLKGKEGWIKKLDKKTPGRPDLVKAGKWNVFLLRAEGKKLTLSINGKEAWSTEDPAVREGYIGIQAEGYRFAFRNIRIKVLKPK